MESVGIIIVAGGKGLRFSEGAGGKGERFAGSAEGAERAEDRERAQCREGAESKGDNKPSSLLKQFTFLGGEPILARTINTFAQALPSAKIIVVLPHSHIDFWRNLSSRFAVAKHKIVEGGDERFHSVKNGVEALDYACEIALIQDGVRPLVTKELILRVLDGARERGAAIPTITPTDSFRIANGEITQAIERQTLRIVQTPQGFNAALLREAYNTPFDARFTDDASLIEAMGEPIYCVEGSRENIKITTLQDLATAEAIIERRNQNLEDDEV